MHTMPPIEENKTTFHEPCLLNVSDTNTKALNRMEITLYVNTKKKTLRKTSFECFELHTYQNAEALAKHSLWRNIITLPVTTNFECF